MDEGWKKGSNAMKLSSTSVDTEIQRMLPVRVDVSTTLFQASVFSDAVLSRAHEPTRVLYPP
jgi:hypothetical protein